MIIDSTFSSGIGREISLLINDICRVLSSFSDASALI